MCERVCAGGAITRTVEKLEEGDKITLTFDLGSCTFCATCADFCSTKAIEFTQDYHMIATKEGDLLVTGTHIRPAKSPPRPSPRPPRRARPQHLPPPPSRRAMTASPCATRPSACTARSAPESALRARWRSTARQRRGSAIMTTASPAGPVPPSARKRQ